MNVDRIHAQMMCRPTITFAAMLAAVVNIEMLAQSGSRSVAVTGTERLERGVIRITYDLGSDTNATYAVALEASNDGGRTFTIQPQAVRGDVGPGVNGGARKIIEWDSAKDTDELQFDRLAFRVTATPSARATPTEARPTTGRINIVTDPPRAVVAIDGQRRGQTPLTVSDVGAGEHRLTLTLDGYLDNSRVITVSAGEQTDVKVTLTRGTVTTAPQKGGVPKWLIPVIAGGGGAGALIAAKASGSTDGTSNQSLNQSFNFEFVSSVPGPQGALLVSAPNETPVSLSITFAVTVPPSFAGTSSWTVALQANDTGAMIPKVTSGTSSGGVPVALAAGSQNVTISSFHTTNALCSNASSTPLASTRLDVQVVFPNPIQNLLRTFPVTYGFQCR